MSHDELIKIKEMLGELIDEKISSSEKNIKEYVNSSHLAVSESVSNFGNTIKKQDKGFWPTILKYLPVIILLATLIVGWTNFGNADAQLAYRTDILEDKVPALQSNVDILKNAITQINTDIGWIRDTLEKNGTRSVVD